MPKYTVHLQQYVEHVATAEIEANSPEEAVSMAQMDFGLPARVDWQPGDDATRMRVWAVSEGDNVVWEND